MQTQHEPAFKAGYSNPLLDVSKHYDIDYGDVLLYADSLRKKEYDNDVHELAAYNSIIAKLKVSAITPTDFHASVAEVMSRRT